MPAMGSHSAHDGTANLIPGVLAELKYSLTPDFLSRRRRAENIMAAEAADLASSSAIDFNPKRIKMEFVTMGDVVSTPVQEIENAPVDTTPEVATTNTERDSSAITTKASDDRVSLGDYLDLVRDRPVIWNSKHEHYHKQTIKKDAWEEIRVALRDDRNLQTSVDRLKQHWKRTMCSFRKSVKKLEKGQHVSFQFFDECQFLLPLSLSRGQLENPSTETEHAEAALDSPDGLPVTSPTNGFTPDVNDKNPLELIESLIAQRQAESETTIEQSVNGTAATPDSTTNTEKLNDTPRDYLHHFGMFVAGCLRGMPIDISAELISDITGQIMTRM